MSQPASSLHLAQRRIVTLASMPAVHRAFRWLHLQQPQIQGWLKEIVGIPAPPFQEDQRGTWFLEAFRALGLENSHKDEVGNVIGELPTVGSNATSPVLLISSHLDTVFPEGTCCDPRQEGNSTKVFAPGICDNAAGLSALLAIAASLLHAGIQPPVPIMFVANVGEEGEGNLRGMRHLFADGQHKRHIAAAIALDGSGTSAVVTSGPGSLRLRVTVVGPGGHSWTDAGVPNPIFYLSRALAELSRLPLSSNPRATLSVGLISGGTSVNSIPESASALLDLRSTESDQIVSVAKQAYAIISQSILESNLESNGQKDAKVMIDVIGDRPAAQLPDDSWLLESVRAVDRHLSIRTDPRIASTDANIPLSYSIPAVTLGGGGIGGGIHTLGEWYDSSGRVIALRRLLLIALDAAERVDKLFEEN